MRAAALAALLLAAAGCGPAGSGVLVPGSDGRAKSSASERAERLAREVLLDRRSEWTAHASRVLDDVLNLIDENEFLDGEAVADR